MAAFFDNGVLFVIVLSALIFVHELGHFLFAKRARVKVERFSLGFGPALWRRTWGETEYRLSAIPLGGYVKMYGEQPDEEVLEPERSFQHQSVWKRIPIVAAGPGFNFIFAILLIAFIYTVGIPVETSVRIEVLKGSAAAAAGLQTDDVIVGYDGKSVVRGQELQSHIEASKGRAVSLDVQRGSKYVHVTVKPRKDEASGQFRIGVKLHRGSVTLERFNPIVALGQGVAWTWEITRVSFIGFGKMISGSLPASESLAGPIGIAREIGRQADIGWRNVVYFTAAISISLAIINLLPIPVLDGGHLMFFAIEIVNGAPLSLRKQEIAQQVGILIILSLMIFAFYNDIANLFLQK
jgi:regulator of sigma E protease